MLYAPRSKPPITSDLFSLAANAWASASDAFSDNVYTEKPFVLEFLWLLACKDINKSASTLRANLTLSRKGINISLSRVRYTFIPPLFSNCRFISFAYDKTISFSCTPDIPIAPGSTPPWPASITIVGRSKGFGTVGKGFFGTNWDSLIVGFGLIVDTNSSWSVGDKSITNLQLLFKLGDNINFLDTFAGVFKSSTSLLDSGLKAP